LTLFNGASIAATKELAQKNARQFASASIAYGHYLAIQKGRQLQSISNYIGLSHSCPRGPASDTAGFSMLCCKKKTPRPCGRGVCLHSIRRGFQSRPTTQPQGPELKSTRPTSPESTSPEPSRSVGQPAHGPVSRRTIPTSPESTSPEPSMSPKQAAAS